MCGIAGYIGQQTDMAPERVLRSMCDSLLHRGPDDGGVLLDESGLVGLGHRRLSVVDLSMAGHQPMHSGSGRYVIVFNGEIYNHILLRKELAGAVPSIAWQGHSDTETLLACFDAWGITPTLTRCVGMFALAVWDKKNRTLSLSRDRMGEKPLYYGWCNGGFVFGSELKALRKYPGFSNALSRDALTLYFRHSYIPAPYAIYQDIYKLEPGCLLTLCQSSAQQMPEQVPRAGCTHKGLTISRYWSLQEQAVAGLSAPQQDNQACLAALETVLKESIQLQSIADVPLGAFLSGGLDSSLIVALMQLQSSRPVRTFTIGFAEQGYNEAEYAKKVAAHLQTEHTELYLDSRQAMDVIPLLPELYDEPFADSSQIPAFLIARMAREHVTVALSGDGGDELFGGYNRYFWAPGIWQKISWLPYTLRQSILRSAAGLSNIFSRAQSGAHRVIPQKMRVALFNEKIHKLRHRLQSVHNIDDFYYSLVSEWRNPEDLVIGGREPVTLLTDKDNRPVIETVEQRMMYLDAMTFLPDDILCKVDRAAMAVSLETRVPFLDHRVVEAAWRLPLDMKIRNGQGKWALRQILYKYVPKELLERPKQGFAIPLGQWLRGPLRDWAEQLLDPGRLAEQGFLRPEPIQQKWTEHLSGKRNWEHSLWSVLMFQAWLEQQQEYN